VDITRLKLKSPEEIVAQLREVIRRYRRKFVSRNLRPCPDNCDLATTSRKRVTGCNGCLSRNPEQCLRADRFVPIYTKDELVDEFAEMLRDPYTLSHDYPAITTLLWVLGEFDEKTVDEQVIAGLERKETT
jgi:hypothetical protein